MSSERGKNWLPGRTKTESRDRRRVGIGIGIGIEIEIEFAAVNGQDSAKIIQSLYGGSIREKTRFETEVVDTELGDFLVELDSSALKEIAVKQSQKQGSTLPLENAISELVAKTSEQLVPWEIVGPPMAFEEAAKLEDLIVSLRDKGALGTRHAIHFAFGVHLNPELPDLETGTIVNYLRAFFCLYDWIAAKEKIDLTRKLTPYIDHFGKGYIEKLIDWNYKPEQGQLIDDYLEANPTRNRSMDMLPLFAHLDQARVKNIVDDPRIKSRPTFHYRLPNCDIDNPRWNLSTPWNYWLLVESLRAYETRLRQFCEEFSEALGRLTHSLDNRWVERCDSLLGDS